MSSPSFTPACPRCNDELIRVRRSRWARIWYLALYRCRNCERNSGVSRLVLFKVTSYLSCPKCGNFRLESFSKPDHIETKSNSPFSLIQKFLGAPLWCCPFCRLQFYDFRKRRVEGA